VVVVSGLQRQKTGEDAEALTNLGESHTANEVVGTTHLGHELREDHRTAVSENHVHQAGKSGCEIKSAAAQIV
jgi:hypothetical protein